MESSFCGCDQGPLAGLHLDTVHLRNVGRDFCQALSFIKDNTIATTNIDNWSFEKYAIFLYLFVINSSLILQYLSLTLYNLIINITIIKFIIFIFIFIIYNIP